MKPLSYEEWRERIGVSIDPGVVEDCEKFHKIDVYSEIENALLREYEEYLNNLPKAEIVIKLTDQKAERITAETVTVNINQHILMEMLENLTMLADTENSYQIRAIARAIISELWPEKE